MPTNIPYLDETWNMICGCSKCSPGCLNCYAEKMAQRLAGMEAAEMERVFRGENRPDRLIKYLPVVDVAKKRWNGEVNCFQRLLEIPLHWKHPRRIGVQFMGDLFHEKVPFEFISKVFDTILECPQHKFLILTKRPERMAGYVLEADLTDDNTIDEGNVHLGVSICNQQEADEKIPILLQIPAAVKWLSIEPLLSEINLEKYLHCGIGWCIVGAESGKNARYMDENWVRSIICQCKKNDVAIFYKQKRVGNKMVVLPKLDGKVYAEYPQTIGKQNVS